MYYIDCDFPVGFTPQRRVLYIPGTQMTLVFAGKGLLLEGSNPKNRGQKGSRYIYIFMSAFNLSSCFSMQFRTWLLRQVLKKAGVKEEPRHFISVLALVAFRMPSSRHFSTIDCQFFRPWQWRYSFFHIPRGQTVSRRNAFQVLSTHL